MTRREAGSSLVSLPNPDTQTAPYPTATSTAPSGTRMTAPTAAFSRGESDETTGGREPPSPDRRAKGSPTPPSASATAATAARVRRARRARTLVSMSSISVWNAGTPGGVAARRVRSSWSVPIGPSFELTPKHGPCSRQVGPHRPLPAPQDLGHLSDRQVHAVVADHGLLLPAGKAPDRRPQVDVGPCGRLRVLVGWKGPPPEASPGHVQRGGGDPSSSPGLGPQPAPPREGPGERFLGRVLRQGPVAAQQEHGAEHGLRLPLVEPFELGAGLHPDPLSAPSPEPADLQTQLTEPGQEPRGGARRSGLSAQPSLRRSGRLRRVLSRAAWRRQASMAAWLPDSRTSGTGIPRNSRGRVKWGWSSTPSSKDSRANDSSLPTTPGTRRVTASSTTSAGISPPERTKSPIEISSAGRPWATRSSTPS